MIPAMGEVGSPSLEQLLDRVSAETRERFRRGEAVVGGKWWQIDPAPNYADASRVLVDESERRQSFGALALPVLYLQRHAVELTLKNLCRAAYDALATLGSELKAPDFDVNHRLKDWLERLATALDAIGLEVPSSAATVVQALRDAGDDDGQSWRYGRVKKKGQSKPAFPAQQNLPIRALQLKVDAFVSNAFGEVPGGDGLFWDLGAIAQEPQLLGIFRSDT